MDNISGGNHPEIGAWGLFNGWVKLDYHDDSDKTRSVPAPGIVPGLSLALLLFDRAGLAAPPGCRFDRGGALYHRMVPVLPVAAAVPGRLSHPLLKSMTWKNPCPASWASGRYAAGACRCRSSAPTWCTAITWRKSTVLAALGYEVEVEKGSTF